MSERSKPERDHEMPDGERIAYLVERRRRPSYTQSGLFWLGGFNSSMEGGKASSLAHWARAKKYECVRFDYSGHGRSSWPVRRGNHLQMARSGRCDLR